MGAYGAQLAIMTSLPYTFTQATKRQINNATFSFKNNDEVVEVQPWREISKEEQSMLVSDLADDHAVMHNTRKFPPQAARGGIAGYARGVENSIADTQHMHWCKTFASIACGSSDKCSLCLCQ